MTGKYLSLIIEYARAKTHAVTPEPQENTTLFDEIFSKFLLKTSLISFLFLKVLSGFINRLKGIQVEFFIFPLLKPTLGSFTSPLNLSKLRASIRLNLLLQILKTR